MKRIGKRTPASFSVGCINSSGVWYFQNVQFDLRRKAMKATIIHIVMQGRMALLERTQISVSGFNM